MALQEGRCLNCGSILYLDGKQENSHCIYCDAVFTTNTALQLALDASGHIFENLPQPKYEGPNLDPATMRSKVDLSKIATNKPKAEVKPEAVFVPSGKQIPSLNLSPKTKIKLVAIFTLILLVFFAAMLPLTIPRDRQRAAIAQNLAAKYSFELSAGKNFSMRRLDNSYAVLALAQKQEADAALQYFKDFCETRAEVMAIDSSKAESIYGKVTMLICTPAGSWLIDKPQQVKDISVVVPAH